LLLPHFACQLRNCQNKNCAELGRRWRWYFHVCHWASLKEPLSRHREVEVRQMSDLFNHGRRDGRASRHASGRLIHGSREVWKRGMQDHGNCNVSVFVTSSLSRKEVRRLRKTMAKWNVPDLDPPMRTLAPALLMMIVASNLTRDD
jgi:hypothetical protein